MKLKAFLDSKIVRGEEAGETFLTWRETIAYALGRGAQGMGTSMMSSNYVNYFVTNLLGIDMIVFGSIRLWGGLWDAVNDVIQGILVDKTRTRHGKMRPYILYAPFAVAFVTVLFFMGGPGLPMGWRLAWVTTLFVAWDMAYTAFDIPMGALAFSITSNGVERTKLFGFSSIVRAVLGALPAGFVTIALAIPYFKENTAPAYLVAAVMSAAGMVIFTRFTFRYTRERAVPSAETPSAVECLRLLLQNRPLFMLFLSNMLFLLATVPSAVTMYFAVDLMGDSKFVLFLTIALAPAPFIAGIGVPMLAEKLGAKADFRKIYMGCCLAAALVHGVFFLACRSGLVNKPSTQAVGWPMAILVVALLALSVIPLEFKNLCGKEMEAETVDCVEWKTGKRAEGVMLSLMSFTGKLTNSWSSSIALFVLGLAKYAAHEDAIPVPQTDTAKFALFALFTLVPIFGYLLMLIPLKFYNITAEGHRRMLAEIGERKQRERTEQ